MSILITLACRRCSKGFFVRRADTSTEPTWQFNGSDQLPDDLIRALAALLLDADPDAAVSVLTNQGNQDDQPG